MATTETPTRPEADAAPPKPDGREAAGHDATPAAPPASPRRRRLRRLAILGALIVILVVGAIYGYPLARTALTTVSTDDAYVNSHVTYVAPRIAETVARVLVDDNDYIRKGDLLVVLDQDVERVRVEQAEAALHVAQRAAEQAVAQARATSALAKANHFKVVSAMTSVRNSAASLRSAVARLAEARTAERLAQVEARRFAAAGERGAETRENVDIRSAEYAQARARTRQAEEEVRRLRVALELTAEPPDDKPLEYVPEDQDQRHSTVITALSAFAQNLADLGLPLPHYHETPNAYIDRIHSMAPNGDLDVLIEQTAAKAPPVESARAKVEQVERDLELARLELSYTEVRADITGFISNRNVNPGNRVVVGQRLMTIRSEDEVWIDCNFKETQLDPIRIGQPVDIYVDAYPDRVFQGRVTGFSPGTGQSLALLPAQNATGNFVKIVQRLPVRVELIHGNPKDTPLFVGLSAQPYVRIHERPEGPNAGQRLRGNFPVVAAPARRPRAPRDSQATYPPTEGRTTPSRAEGAPGAP